MTRSFPCVAILSLALVAGCGGAQSGGESAADGPQDPGSRSSAQGQVRGSGDAIAPVPKAGSNPEFDDINADGVKFENTVAGCMKKQGFTYIPHPMVYGGGPGDSMSRNTERASLLEPADAVRKWRQKYGFGVYASQVFPNDPQVSEPEPAANPNDAIVNGLDPARRKAYHLALSGDEDGNTSLTVKQARRRPSADQLKKQERSCQGKAGKGSDNDSGESPAQRKKAASDLRTYRKFQSDPAVVAAAQEYVNCLRKSGFRPVTTRPGSIETALAHAVPLPKDGISKAAAERGLAKEVKAALADLDCRTSYATIVRTKYPAIVNVFPGQG